MSNTKPHKIDTAQILFIINPKSGYKHTQLTIRYIKTFAPKAEYVIRELGIDLDKQVKGGVDRFHVMVAVGGDGTIRSLIPEVKKHDKILAVLPHGSGNGFAFEMGFTYNIRALLKAIERNKFKYVDQLNLNEYRSINVSGVGFDSYVAHSFQKQKIRGIFTYLKVSFFLYFKFKPFDATIFVNGRKIEGRYMAITVANTRQFGNNAIISPNSNPTDSKYELVLTKNIPIIKLPYYAVRLLRGTLSDTKYIQYIQTSGETIIDAPLEKIHVDGDAVFCKMPLKVKLIHKSFKVLEMN